MKHGRIIDIDSFLLIVIFSQNLTKLKNPMKEYNVTVGDNGRIVIPAIYRKQLNIKPGDDVILSLSADNDIILHSPKQSLQKLQNLVAKKKKKNLVNLVIEMRRKEEV